MSVHVMQSRDLIAELQRYPLDCEVVGQSGEGNLVLGDVTLHGGSPHRRRVCIDIDAGEMMNDLEGENKRLDKLEGAAALLLEQFDALMESKMTSDTDVKLMYKNLLKLHEKVATHLKNR